MANPKLTAEAVTAAMERAVAEKGSDHVYQQGEGGFGGGGCFYTTTDGKPDCIVGHVIAELDPDYFADIVAFEAYHGRSEEIAGLSMIGCLWQDRHHYDTAPALPPLDLDGPVRNALNEAQALQDIGHSWGLALVAYKDALNAYTTSAAA